MQAELYTLKAGELYQIQGDQGNMRLSFQELKDIVRQAENVIERDK